MPPTYWYSFACSKTKNLLLNKIRSIWESDAKLWGLSHNPTNPNNQKKGVEKEKAFHEHMNQLEQQLLRLNSQQQNKRNQEQHTVVGLGGFMHCSFNSSMTGTGTGT
jgi:hypothetical protein